MPSIRYATQEPTMFKANSPCNTTEEVRTHGSCCSSRHPTTRYKPNTTHAPLGSTSPKIIKLTATNLAQGHAGNHKLKTTPRMHQTMRKKGQATLLT
ncbi:unnamed protein product [Lactuca virosa]|uniref:Uncharacterized protein n=1 Tax=Lactuca virosa TaxID=75947 RepID=A0AAU9LYM5_9ASTR|nr:unnamed protein product [Lactuca virosa]CAH1419446.1 unnamed protein product [Lactuca virosa]CAH1419448.1 unnamed protein product [Lactuca virosa]CAH1419450.1 unnamed protein product [Lactuca virosa]CAH1419452.1 unnamed protein product [Lactuca virosa]